MKDGVKQICPSNPQAYISTPGKLVRLQACNDNGRGGQTVSLQFCDHSPESDRLEAEVISFLLRLDASNDN